MIAKLFDIQNFKIIPTIHCHTISWLKDIMDEYKGATVPAPSQRRSY